MAKKTPSKTTLRKAAKTLGSPSASKTAKSKAGKTLSQGVKHSRTVKPAPKKGRVSTAKVRKAVKSASARRKSRGSSGSKRSKK